MAFKMKGFPMHRTSAFKQSNNVSPLKQGGLEYCPECGQVFEGEDAFNQMAEHIHEAHFGGGPFSGTPGYTPHQDPGGWEPGDPTGTADQKEIDERFMTPD